MIGARPRQTEIPMTSIVVFYGSTSAHSQSLPPLPPLAAPQTRSQPPQTFSAARSYLRTRRRYPLNITSTTTLNLPTSSMLSQNICSDQTYNLLFQPCEIHQCTRGEFYCI